MAQNIETPFWEHHQFPTLPLDQKIQGSILWPSSKIKFFSLNSVRIFKSTPRIHTDPLSSTHRFHTKTTPFQHPKSGGCGTEGHPIFNTKSIFEINTKYDFQTKLRYFESKWNINNTGGSTITPTFRRFINQDLDRYYTRDFE